MTPRPVPLTVIPEGIPATLRALDRWVVWRYEWRTDRWTKVPYVATAPEQPASVVDRSTWRTFAQAVATYADGKADGIGFVLGDGYTGFDKDCAEGDEHVRLLNSYTERSVGGTGTHTIVRGTKPGPKCRTGPYELYDQGRYLTVSGHHVPDTPTTVEERTTELAALYGRLFPTGTPSPAVADDELLARAHAAKNSEKFSALWRGDLAGYDSHSEADAALCALLAFWTHRDAAQMDRLFRRSGLMREKWDSRRNDTTYGASVIHFAIGSAHAHFYDAQLDLERARRLARRTCDAEDAALRPAPVLVFDGEDLWGPLAWLIHGLLPAEGLGMLFGETDVGKTFVALSMGIAISAGLPWQGHAVTPGTTLYIEAEGGRSFALRKHVAKQQAGVDSGRNRLPFEPLPFVMSYEALAFGPDTDLALVQRRATTIRDAVAVRGLPPICFVVVDTLAQNLLGNADSNEDMTAFLRLFRAFLKALAATPVFGLLIHHPGHVEKDRARGAYALPADLDLIMKLEGTPGALTLSCARLRDEERWPPLLLALEKRFVTMDDGVVESSLGVASRRGDAVAPPVSLAARIVAHLTEHPEQTTEQIRRDLGVRKDAVVTAVDTLKAAGQLVLRPVTLGKNTSQRYRVTCPEPANEL